MEGFYCSRFSFIILTDNSLTITDIFILVSATSNSILDRAIDSEQAQHNDFLRLVRNLISPKNYAVELFVKTYSDE